MATVLSPLVLCLLFCCCSVRFLKFGTATGTAENVGCPTHHIVSIWQNLGQVCWFWECKCIDQKKVSHIPVLQTSIILSHLNIPSCKPESFGSGDHRDLPYIYLTVFYDGSYLPSSQRLPLLAFLCLRSRDSTGLLPLLSPTAPHTYVLPFSWVPWLTEARILRSAFIGPHKDWGQPLH